MKKTITERTHDYYIKEYQFDISLVDQAVVDVLEMNFRQQYIYTPLQIMHLNDEVAHFKRLSPRQKRKRMDEVYKEYLEEHENSGEPKD